MDTKPKVAIPAIIKRMTLQLVIAYVLNFIGFTLLLGTMAITGRKLLEGQGAAGVPLSLLSGVAILSALPFAKAADRIGRRAAIVIMIVFYALGDLCGLVAIQQANGTLYLVAMGLLGVGVGAMALFSTAVTDLYPGAYKGRASGFAQLGVMAANTLGYLIGGQLVTYLGPTSVYYTAAACQVLSIALMVGLRLEPREVARSLQSYWPKEVFHGAATVVMAAAAATGTATGTAPERRPRSAVRLLFLWPILLAVVVRIWNHLGTNFVNVALPVAFNEIGYSLAAISMFMVVRALAAFVTADFTGRIIDRYGRKIGYIGAPIVNGIGIVLIAFGGNPALLFIGCALIGFGNAIANVVPPAVCNDVTYLPERATAVAIFGISTNIGGFIFPVPMAIILTHYGMTGLALACAAFLMIPVVLVLLLIREKSAGVFVGYEVAERHA
jgi:MFS family permease